MHEEIDDIESVDISGTLPEGSDIEDDSDGEKSLLDLADILKTRHSNRIDWLLPFVIPTRGRVILYGHGGIGKTRLLYDLAAAIASKSSAWGGHEVSTQAKALIVAGEGDPAINCERLRYSLRSHDITAVSERTPKEILRFHGTTYLLDNEDDQAKFTPIVEAIRPGLVVIDPLNSYFSGDENSVKEVKMLTHYLDGLIAGQKCTVLLAHHAAQGDGTQGLNKPRGSTAWYGWADTILRVRLVKHGFLEVTVEKQRNGPSKFGFRIAPLMDVGLGVSFFRHAVGPILPDDKPAKKGEDIDPEEDDVEDDVDDEGDGEPFEGGEVPLSLKPLAERRRDEATWGLKHAILRFLTGLPARACTRKQMMAFFRIRRSRLWAAVDELLMGGWLRSTALTSTTRDGKSRDIAAIILTNRSARDLGGFHAFMPYTKPVTDWSQAGEEDWSGSPMDLHLTHAANVGEEDTGISIEPHPEEE